jgi:hypothetical protein
MLTDEQKSAKGTAQLMAAAVWRKHVTVAIGRLAKLEEIGHTQASAYLAEALEVFCKAAQEPWDKAR